MTVMDETLIRKKSEHNDGLLKDLEEIALHQLSISKIENLGYLCKNLKILLLQNNLIGKIENLHKLKALVYLNLAINNITKVENLDRCESLQKLDLTMNLIDFDTFGESISNLVKNTHLEDLYLMGNPACNESLFAYRLYVIGNLPQLKQLDGALVSYSERQSAVSELKRLSKELLSLGESVRKKKLDGSYTRIFRTGCEDGQPNELVRDIVPLNPDCVKKSINVCQDGTIRQCNEGHYKYILDEMSVPGKLVFSIETPKYMDTSLISVDLHPTYVCCVINKKRTQVRFDDSVEIAVSESRIVRAKSTGTVRVEAPLVGWQRGASREKTMDEKHFVELFDLPPRLEGITN